MALLIIGLVLFLGIHVVPMSPSLKASIIARIGENGYKLAFSVLSLIGLVLIVIGFGQFRGSAGDIELWSPPTWTRHIAFALMLPAFILIVAAYVPSDIRAWAGGHPMLLGVILWAFAHLVANGDLAGLLLFGAFLVWAVVDRISAGKRAALGPLGRRSGHLTGDIIAVAIGALLYALMLKWGHPLLIGVPLIG
ncbi:MAG: NnrU family protein [Methylobacteriaceae bacterium]|nr:NnrU family protein [Methylobacteriaceae bacterium]